MVVASPDQHFRLLLVRTQKRRDHLLRVIPHTMHYQLLHTPQTRRTAMRVSLRLPGVGRRPFRGASHFYRRFRPKSAGRHDELIIDLQGNKHL